MRVKELGPAIPEVENSGVRVSEVFGQDIRIISLRTKIQWTLLSFFTKHQENMSVKLKNKHLPVKKW